VRLEETDEGYRITEIALSVPGRRRAHRRRLRRITDEAKRTCPVSRALAGTTITLAQTKVVG